MLRRLKIDVQELPSRFVLVSDTLRGPGCRCCDEGMSGGAGLSIEGIATFDNPDGLIVLALDSIGECGGDILMVESRIAVAVSITASSRILA